MKVFVRRVDMSSVALALVGAICFAGAYYLIEYRDFNSLTMIPSLFALWNGLTHLTVIEAREVMDT